MSLLTRLRRLKLGNIGLYGLSTGLAALLTLVMTRVLWRALDRDDFGTWALIDPMLLPAASLVLLGVDHAIVKQFRVDKQPLRLVTGTLLMTTLPATILCVGAAAVATRSVFHLAWADALLITMVGEALILMMQTAFRATGAVKGYAALLLSRNILYLGVLLAAQRFQAPSALSLGTVFFARGGCVVLVSLMALAVLRPIPRWHWGRYRDAVRYGFPLLLTTFIYALSDMTDRWFLAEFRGVADVGVYSLHLKVAAILSQAIVIPFGLWFPPERFKRMQDPDGGRQFFINTAIALSIVCAGLSGGIWLLRDTILGLIAPGVAISSFVLVCNLGSVVCLALSQALNVGLLLPGHTSKNPICTGVAVLLNVAVCAALVPWMGMTGAAVGRMAAGLGFVVAIGVWSNSVFPLTLPTRRIWAFYATAAILAAGVDKLVRHDTPLGAAASIIAWTILLAGCAVVVFRSALNGLLTSKHLNV